jgi:methyl-accepting chemotaxis protein
VFAEKSLNFKLRSSFAVMIIFLLLVGVIGIVSLRQATEKYQHISQINLQKSITLGQMDTTSREVLRQLLQFMLIGNSPKDKDKISEDIKTHREEYKTSSKIYEAIPFDQGEEELYKTLNNSWKKMETLFDTAATAAKSPMESDKILFSNLYRGDLKEPRDTFFATLDKLILFQTQQAEAWKQKAEETAEHAKKLMLLTLFIGMGFAIFISLKISNGLTTQLRFLAQSLSDGSHRVDQTSSQIAATSIELSEATTEQAASLEETTSSIHQISSMINQNTEGARSSALMSEQSLQNAENGKKVVDQMILAIGDINNSNKNIMNQINESNREIEDIVQVIAEIGTKTKVINNIVFQTKLLSFNASVEAARAGEHGKGFAVVAEEIGNLAAMSGTAAQEISELLDGSIQKVENIVQTSKVKIETLVTDARKKVETGTKIANECGNVLTEIVGSISKVSKMASDISRASEEQAQGVHEITKAMAQLDQVTQKNTTASAESANTAESLSAQAESLNVIVKSLVNTIEGGESTPSTANITEKA